MYESLGLRKYFPVLSAISDDGRGALLFRLGRDKNCFLGPNGVGLKVFFTTRAHTNSMHSRSLYRYLVPGLNSCIFTAASTQTAGTQLVGAPVGGAVALHVNMEVRNNTGCRRYAFTLQRR